MFFFLLVSITRTLRLMMITALGNLALLLITVLVRLPVMMLVLVLVLLLKLFICTTHSNHFVIPQQCCAAVKEFDTSSFK